MTQTYTTLQGDMLDLIAYRHYGYHEGTVEAILAHWANYRLADHPHVLPAGIVITLPELPSLGERMPQPVRLWD